MGSHPKYHVLVLAQPIAPARGPGLRARQRSTLHQHHLQSAVAERQGLRQPVRRPRGAGRHLLHLASKERRLGPALRPERGPFQFLCLLSASWTDYCRPSDRSEVPVAAEQVEIGVDVVIGGDGVEDEVQAASMLPRRKGAYPHYPYPRDHIQGPALRVKSKS